MTTRVVKEGNVTTTVVDMTNGVGGRSAEVRKMQTKSSKYTIHSYHYQSSKYIIHSSHYQSIQEYHYYMSPFMCISDNLLDTSRYICKTGNCKGPVEKHYHILEGHRNVKEEGKVI